LRDFEDGLIQKLEELRGLYARNVQTIRGLCSQMAMEDPSTKDYLRWLSEEVSGLPDMFSGVNEKFVTAAIKGALTMAGDSVDLDAIQGAAAESGMDVLPAGPNVRRATRAVSKKWWRSFGYNYVLAATHAKHEEVFTCLRFSF
jgi:hypothetical protein